MKGMRRLFLLALASLAAGLSFAQENGPPPEGKELTEAEVSRALSGAKREILLETPYFDLKPVAEGIRIAAAERGVRVYILAAKGAKDLQASFLAWATLLPNVEVRLLAWTPEEYLILDREAFIRITRDPLGARFTLLDRSSIPVWTNRFLTGWRRAPRLRPEDAAWPILAPLLREVMRQ